MTNLLASSPLFLLGKISKTMRSAIRFLGQWLSFDVGKVVKMGEVLLSVKSENALKRRVLKVAGYVMSSRNATNWSFLFQSMEMHI